MKSLDELAKIKEATIKASELKTKDDVRVLVGLATCGIAAGARPVYDAFNTAVKADKLSKVKVLQTGCIGMCQYEPIVEVFRGGEKKVTYVKMTPDKVERIIKEHIIGGQPVVEYTIGEASGEKGVTSISDTVFYKYQKRIALRNCGVIDPETIEDYIAVGGYEALGKVLTSMTSADVIKTVLDSGLRGRGGGGFPTGRKWDFAAKSVSKQKYVVCNADEGDPGAFMDRSVLEGDPHALLEAMAIAGYAIGANQGYIYVRAEYPVAVKRLGIAIEQAKKKGLLGRHIFGTAFNFDIQLRLGAGAFVCGEETALLTSIEGNRGEPRPRPPFPAVKGLFGQPTIINNVETYANIAQIIVNGADWFRGIGTERSRGTKVFALGGKINNTGLVEIPMGTPLRTIIEKIGGGIPNGKQFKAAQTGGPSGGCIPASLIDTPVEYDTLVAIGSMMGSGGLIVMDEDNCMVDIAKFFLEFTVDESCGKCTPCREGTRRMLDILNRITDGKGELADLDKLEELGKTIKATALCGLGQTAPNPVLSTMRYFRDEYTAHVTEKRCPAGHCKKLARFEIDPAKCRGCSLCARNCPADAISGVIKSPYTIDQSKCIKCGACMDNCKFGAISKK